MIGWAVLLGNVIVWGNLALFDASLIGLILGYIVLGYGYVGGMKVAWNGREDSIIGRAILGLFWPITVCWMLYKMVDQMYKRAK